MTFATARQLLADSKALFQGVEAVTVNLANVEHADSAGLALLLEWIARVNQAGEKISIEGMPESLLAIARLCRVADTLQSMSVKDKE